MLRRVVYLTEALARNSNNPILLGLNAQLLAREGKFEKPKPLWLLQPRQTGACGTTTTPYLRACVYALGGKADRIRR